MALFTGISLCAGIGGLDLGIKAVLPDFKTICYVEREAYPAAILAARMEDKSLDPAPVWDCLTTFDGEPWRGCVDIITAGYPCQPFSVAGKRQGEKDLRHLWPHVRRIIGEVRPTLAFLENVPGHIGLGLQNVRNDLHAMGYCVQAGIFSALEVGAPHIRKRLFILAYADGEHVWEQRRSENALESPPVARNDGSSRHVSDTDGPRLISRRCAASGPFRNGTRWAESQRPCSEMADADSHGRTERLAEPKIRCGWDRSNGCGTHAYTHRKSAQRASIPWRQSSHWRVEPGMGRMADGISDRVDKLRALGNAVVPECAAKAFASLVMRL